MIEWVYKGASESTLLNALYVATDHEEIFDCVIAFGGKAVLTASTHKTGTERCNEAVNMLAKSFDAVINIQGDEPLIKAGQIDLLATLIAKKNIDIATLCMPVSEASLIHNPNNIKVVFDNKHRAMYFSRAPIPFSRSKKLVRYFEHIGMYAYKTEVLHQLVKLKPGKLEEIEKLEQLRWMENGYRIYLAETQSGNISVDTPEDLQKLIKKIRSKRHP